MCVCAHARARARIGIHVLLLAGQNWHVSYLLFYAMHFSFSKTTNDMFSNRCMRLAHYVYVFQCALGNYEMKALK